MPDFQNRNSRDYSKYDMMDDEQLQTILREDASKPEGEESDMEMLLYVMEVLAKRRNERNEKKDPEAALESFYKNYYTDGKKTLISGFPAKKHSGGSRWKRGLAAAAAALALIIGSTVTARAFGFDLWDTITKWTQETFHFGYAGQHEDGNDPANVEELPYDKLQEALMEFHVTQDLVPTWLPDGYEAVDVRTVETPLQRQFIAKYQSGDQEIKIWIADYLNSFPNQIEQSESALEEYESAGIIYYIFSDVDSLQAVWINDTLECYISGPLTLSEIKNMIDSIGKG